MTRTNGSEPEQVTLSTPVLINLKLDFFERFTKARGYDEWSENRSWIFGQAGKGLAKFVETFKEYPPSQKGMSVQVTNLSETINFQSMNLWNDFGFSIL